MNRKQIRELLERDRALAEEAKNASVDSKEYQEAQRLVYTYADYHADNMDLDAFFEWVSERPEGEETNPYLLTRVINDHNQRILDERDEKMEMALDLLKENSIVKHGNVEKVFYGLFSTEGVENAEVSVFTGEKMENPVPDALFPTVPLMDTFEEKPEFSEFRESVANGDGHIMATADYEGVRFSAMVFPGSEDVLIHFLKPVDLDEFDRRLKKAIKGN